MVQFFGKLTSTPGIKNATTINDISISWKVLQPIKFD